MAIDVSPQSTRSLLQELKATGSSFYWAIRLLPNRRRTDLSVLYLFCRAVDDIADGSLPMAQKQEQLDGWKAFLAEQSPQAPHPSLGVHVSDLLRRHPLLRSLLQEIVAGISMDLPPGLQAPDDATFSLYCRRVAGYVGMALVRLLGCHNPTVDRFALAAGDALQFTNILRDIKPDAELGRLYLPASVLEKAGVKTRDPQSLLADPALPQACSLLATMAEASFEEALTLFHSDAISEAERRSLRPARVMIGSYHLILRRLQSRGWARDHLGENSRPSAVRLLIEAVRCYALGSP